MEAVTATNCGLAPGETPPPCTDQNSDCSSWLASNGVGTSMRQSKGQPVNCAVPHAQLPWMASKRAQQQQERTHGTPAAVCKDGSANQCPGWANGGYCNGGTISYGTPISQFCAESCGTCTTGSSTSSTGSSSSSASTDIDTNCPSYKSQSLRL